LAVEKLIHGASHLLQGQIAIDTPLKDRLGSRRWLKPLHAHAGKRVLNFSFALYPSLTGGRYGHLLEPLKCHLSYQVESKIASTCWIMTTSF
jgi:hypothetical protein